ncbi:serine/threonine-protein kinase [Nocardioides acrostichi]|uniref:non-specific serine/threonine protein kinase n=1 Tax=Nocardioides acrostichi TaxID=2784339 RepID=A0A930V0C4_9ACTN|nr:serine/threonine-protein kinase [Nocardioides acrostichi]MBF4161385.1 serine/threonine protein kinase [Nocardioides acrostichi]
MGSEHASTPRDDTRLAGRYRLHEVIGRGGFAEVFRADDARLGRAVALKRLRSDKSDTASRARLAEETRVMAGLQHPRIIRVLDAAPAEGWMVLELVEGRDLSAAIADGPLLADHVTRIGIELCHALAHAHSRGVVHRDVNPANVLLDQRGHAHLTDFGVAATEGSPAHDTEGRTLGTRAYLAPEQVRGDTVTGRTDVYAAGLVLLEALTGRREYHTGNSDEIAFARLARFPTIPASLPRGWPRLLASMTALEPQERPAAEDAANQMLSLLRGGGVPEHDRATRPAGATTTSTIQTPPVSIA